MRDAVGLERRGIPTVTVSQAPFETAARAQAVALGLPDLPLVVVPQRQLDDMNIDFDARAEETLPGVIRGLTSAAPSVA